MKNTPYSVMIWIKGHNPIVGETDSRLSDARRRLRFESQINDGRIVDIVTANGVIIASNIPDRINPNTK